MGRFVEGADRSQATLLPECLDDFIAEDNPTRIVDAFVDELELASLGFEGATPAATGRPSYHPAVLLKIYIYGYLNRLQSSRRLERECQRNVELMWLTGRLAPDFKTIADFGRSNEGGIRNVCRRFVMICRDLKLFTQAIVAVDTRHHLIVTHEVTNVGSDRSQLSPMAKAARDAMGKRKIKALVDRGYFSAPEIKACDDAGIAAMVPKAQTSSAKADGRFDRAGFIYIANDDQYLCPAGQRATYRYTSLESANLLETHTYWSSACPRCPLKSQCTPADYRRISRWEHEAVLEAMQLRLDRQLDAMTTTPNGRTCVRHPQTLDGSTHFQTRGLGHVAAEMSLHVLAYNLKRVIRILGFVDAMRAMKLAGA